MSRRPWGQRGSTEELSSALSIFDREGDGYINAAEFRHLMTTAGEALTDEQMDDMMNQLDTDGDGKVPLAGQWPPGAAISGTLSFVTWVHVCGQHCLPYMCFEDEDRDHMGWIIQ